VDFLVISATGVPDSVTVVGLSFIRERLPEATNFHGESASSDASIYPPRIGTPAFGEHLDSSLVQRLRIVLSPPMESLLSGQDSVLKWPGDLMPFQKEGVRALVDSERILLADDMGLGKTLQVIAAVRILCWQQVIESILVVAPASLLDQWRRELEKWAPELQAIIIRGPAADRSWQWTAKVHLTLVSYETLRSDFGGNTQAPVRRKIWDVVVADEAQRIKNRNYTSDALKGLQRRRSWAVTGTPIENNEEELASILEFVDHEGLKGSKHYKPGHELLDRHRQLQLRRKKGDVLDDLPPKQTTKTIIPLNAKQKESYDKAERDGIVYLKSLGAEVRIQHVLELITRLKQICNADPKTGDSSKLEDIKERLAQLVAQGHKALVFSQYTSETFGVVAAANYMKAFNPLTLTGDMAQSQRTSIIDRFKTTDKHKLLVLSLRAGGLGLNLQEASYVFHLDRWWNPAVEHQAEDRSHRYGQTTKVNVIKYSCMGTIEERIDAVLKRKQDLFDQLIDDVSLNLSTKLSSEEFFGLFGLEPPRA
jgi:SNF2 family DNA or RNA helicase